MLDELAKLEETARRLEPDQKQRAALNRGVEAYANQFLNALPGLKTYVADDLSAATQIPAISDDPASLEEALAYLASAVDKTGINPASGGHIGYIPGGGIYAAALGDYLADVFNRYAGVLFAGPGAVRLEKSLLRWMGSLIGFPEGAAGDLTSGGSMANLTGIVAGREAREVRAVDIPRTVVYLSAQAHHSIEKALRVAGLGECVLRFLELDECYRIRPDALATAVETDRADALIPWLVVASAGTTDVGAVDPIDALADVCQQQDLWLHVDAAYGGFFVLCDAAKELLGGMSRADSVVMDPHKGLFLPYGSGAVLVRDQAAMHRAFAYQAHYMQDAIQDVAMMSPADLSPELSRPFRGLRLWLPLMIHGLAPFRAALDEKLLLAKYFHQEIQKVPGFEVGPEPQLSVATYRYVPKKGDADQFNKLLIDELQKDGRVFVSSTRVNDRFVLRAAILNFRTHRDTVDLTIEILTDAALRLAGQGNR